ncbi:acyl-CoA dehydrogenase family protein [Pseudomonas aeruginosa]|nr:acyl-CoA dehydrogenase family protein [Pseudomonas aeruginosa]
MVAAIAMTEPGAGSDLQGVKTTAVLDGDEYVINGSKTFITNGFLADLVIVVAKTDRRLAPRAQACSWSRRRLCRGLQQGQAPGEGRDEGPRTPRAVLPGCADSRENLLGKDGRGSST